MFARKNNYVRARRLPIAGLCIVLGLAIGAAAQVIPPGVDCFDTTDAFSEVVFGGDLPPIPADFFGPGSDPFDGIIALRGEPLGSPYPGDVSTVVERLEPAMMPGPAPVQVEMVELSLVSIEPIMVTYWGGMEIYFFDVFVTLSDLAPSMGYMSIWETMPGIGGEYDFSSASGGGIYIHPKFVLIQTEPPYQSYVLDDPAYGVLLENDYAEPPPTWQYEEPAVVCYPGNEFYPVPGVAVLGLLNGGYAGAHGVIPPHQQLEACCFDDGGCLDLLEDDCFAAGGTPQGAGTACSADTVACCLTGGGCLDVDPLCCDDLGGTASDTSTMCLGDYNDDGIDDACDPDLCKVPDDGTGTVALPPEGCDYLSPTDVHLIIEGLPPGTTIELDPIHRDFIDPVRTPGGSLGGEIEVFDSTLDLTVSGTGELEGFNRHLAVPISCEVHTGPRNPGDPVQTFANDMYRLQGQLYGDPDFCEFIVTAGTDFGLPSPGQTTLTQLPDGDFAVDSFFDITYQIQFEGCPGSQLDGYAGTTTATIRMQTGHPEPQAEPCCLADGSCSDMLPGDCLILGGYLVPACLGDVNGDGIDEACDPDACIVPDNGTGTVTLPPEGCDYIGPEELHLIIEGLPPGTTIELDPIHEDFFNVSAVPGGTLGGEIEYFDSTLDLTVTGTGSLEGFNRHLAVPISCEVHTGPRNPGDPVQSFPNDMYRLQGQLYGDPDFCELIITGGTDFGMPSPGQTTLTQLPSGDFAVDSFFDVTYQIQFEGCPGSLLDGYAGTTTGLILMETGNPARECRARFDGSGCLDAQCPGGGGALLVSQPPNQSASYVDDCAFPEVLAEDFTLSGPTRVGTVRFWGYHDSGTPLNNWTISFYDDNAGLPGTEVYTYVGPGGMVQTGSFWEITVDLPSPLPALNAGTWWVAMYTDSGGVAGYWGRETGDLDPLAGIAGLAAAFECPPSSWGSYTSPDFAFELYGSEEQCIPRCLNFDPATGQTLVADCACRYSDDCRVVPAASRQDDPCVVADNGTGTITLPPQGCEYLSPDEVHEIIDGLPPGTTIELDPIHMDFICSSEPQPACSMPLAPGECETEGGSLGGHGDCFESTLDLTVTGTGDLAGYNRHLWVPIFCEVHTGPRNPGDPVQSFPNEMYRLQGELFGDPDFCTFRVFGGSDFGLPGPGMTTLTQLPSGDFAVDSFFDITYQIEFEGCPGSPLDGYAGITTATIRMQTPTAQPPTCVGDCPTGFDCVETVTGQPDGTIDVCCDCLPVCTALDCDSCRNHPGGDPPGPRLCLNMGVSGGVEPRLGGITELDVTLDDVTAFGGGVAVDCGPCSWGGSAGASVAGNVVTLTFDTALPDQCCCTVTLDCDAEVCVCGLQGDIDRSGLVSTGDASIIKPKFGQTPTAATAQFDFDVSGLISTGDFSQVKPKFGHTLQNQCP